MKARYAIVIGLAVLAAGCSSTPAAVPQSTATTTTVPATSTTTTIAPTTTTTTVAPTSTSTTVAATTAALARQFLAAATLVDVEYRTWKAEIAGKTQVSQFVGPATAYAGVLTTFDNSMAHIAFTGKVAAGAQVAER
jgi:PBP1b-binding outer membrane lipoprotein LpoB